MIGPQVDAPSVLLLYRISSLPRELSYQTICTWLLESAAIAGKQDSPEFQVKRFMPDQVLVVVPVLKVWSPPYVVPSALVATRR